MSVSGTDERNRTGLLAHLTLAGAGWDGAGYTALLGAIVTVSLGQAVTMARYGPAARLHVPAT